MLFELAQRNDIELPYTTPAEQNVVYVEPFFDPQGHTTRGADSAVEHLQMAEPYLDWIVGVGLDSDEADNPTSKFADVFRDARAMGLKLTMHCDVNQKDIVAHMRECLDVIEVDRLDHGISALDDARLVEALQQHDIGLTICPISNRFVVQTLTGDEIRRFLQAGIKATVNSHDPTYFRGYMSENLAAEI